MTPFRSRPYLDLSYAPGKSCIACRAPAAEPAHFSGLGSDKVGKGAGQKSADVVVADYCRSCHETADLYKDGNDESRALYFLLDCWRTLLRNIEQGHVGIVVHTVAVQRDTRPSRERRRKKQFSTARPMKADGSPAVVPRRGLV